MADGHESRFIQKIVEDVLNKLDTRCLNVARYLVGLDSRVHDIIGKLSIDTNDVRIVGIHGMGGLGKTTLAKAVFNQLHYEFEGSSFLCNVGEKANCVNGVVKLQKMLLGDILKQETWNISDVDNGMILLKERLCRKKVLVVVDDAAQLETLGALVGARSWFGSGSKIIITTRDEFLLDQLEVDEKYRAEELNQVESLTLFSRHAFKDNQPIEDYVKLSNDVVNYCGGLPLALKVVGSSLFKRSKSEWRSAIDILQKTPHHDIQKTLRISFDRLDDDRLKSMFLDIACFFTGMKKDSVARILEARYTVDLELCFTTLMERSLLTINKWNELVMHDLLRDVGREIVHQMSPNCPGNRSRIWHAKDARNVLYNQTGTEKVEALSIDVRATNDDESVNTETFTRMRNLQLLQIDGVQLTGNFSHLPRGLKWLRWRGCPLRILPTAFQLHNVVVLDMKYSNLKELWKDNKSLNKLKILDLSFSKLLVKLPKIHSPRLERLILEGCSSLTRLNQYIGSAENLEFINLNGCSNLRNLPESIIRLKSLQILDISGCSKLVKLPERLGELDSLTNLLADGTAIDRVPFSIGNLRHLEKLSLRGCRTQDVGPLSCLSRFSSLFSLRSSNSQSLLAADFQRLNSLIELNLSHCGLSDSEISFSFGSLPSLRQLNLSGNNFRNLSWGIGHLDKLVKLVVANCTNLFSISELPICLIELYGCCCTSLERVSIQSKFIPALILSGCQNLIEIEGINGVRNFLPILLDNCHSLSDNFKKNLVQSLQNGERSGIFLPGDEIPDWFSHSGDQSSLSFLVPTVSEGKLQGLVVWIVCAANETGFVAFAIIRNKSNDIQLFRWFLMLPCQKISTNHSWLNYRAFTGLPCPVTGGEELELSVVTYSEDAVILKCGVHLRIEKPDTRDMSQGIAATYSQAFLYKDLEVESKEEFERRRVFNNNLEVRAREA